MPATVQEHHDSWYEPFLYPPELAASLKSSSGAEPRTVPTSPCMQCLVHQSRRRAHFAWHRPAVGRSPSRPPSPWFGKLKWLGSGGKLPIVMSVTGRSKSASSAPAAAKPADGAEAEGGNGNGDELSVVAPSAVAVAAPGPEDDELKKRRKLRRVNTRGRIACCDSALWVLLHLTVITAAIVLLLDASNQLQTDIDTYKASAAAGTDAAQMKGGRHD